MVEMKRKKYAILALLVGAIIICGVVYMGDNPDWTLPVSIRAQEIENLSVDIASQSISELTIRIKAQDVPVTIEPAAGVTFNIAGSVDATVQGTADINIKNAEITVDVATVREKASEENKVGFASKGGFVDDGDTKSVVVFTNTLGQTVYIEMLTFTVWKYNVTDPTLYPLDFRIDFGFYYSDGTEFAWIYSNPGQNVINLNPAIPLPPNGYIAFYIKNQGNAAAEFESSVVYRKP